MRRNLTILVAALLVAGLAIGGIVPAVSAHGDADSGTDQSPYAGSTDAGNATEAHAAAIAQSMMSRMGPDGVEAFEQQTGVPIEVFAYAMAEQMQTQSSTWNESTAQSPYSSGGHDGYQAPGGAYGPQAPYGPQMPHGPQMPCGGPGAGAWGSQDQGFFGGLGFNNGFGPWSSGPSRHGGGGHGMGGHGMGGHMGGGW